ncbi:VOC family protein [Novosphingobium sp.]|uniref:VOC family protein n=1 Tax=Novosphingobium sp. TaxID=1874826 RepID=UPI00286E35E9|nr:VOC family protein [Novosphingobium sp.]
MISLDNGFQEAVAIVADMRASSARLRDTLKFKASHSGAVPAPALDLLGFAGGEGSEVLLVHPDSERGAIRLIEVHGDPLPRTRDGGQSWDPGGIFDINMRALQGIEPLHRALSLSGFSSPAPITDWDFGPLSVREVVEADADGVVIALMERVAPMLQGYEGIGGPASWVFNSTQIVPDFAAARAFYCETLGWQVVQETQLQHPDGRNCMGLPVRLAPGIGAQVGIYHPHGRMEGSVEIIAFDCGGIDFSDAAPGRGWACLRFMVSDAASMLERAGQGDCTVTPLVELDWQPHGRCLAGSIRTPWGARLEVLQAV